MKFLQIPVTSSYFRLFGILGAAASILALSSCGGSSGGSDNGGVGGGDPTLTLYAPQTLGGVELQIDDPDGPGIAYFTFTSTARVTPEQETGTFTYINDSLDDGFADQITDGLYTYEVTSANTGLLRLTGGEGIAANENSTRFLGTLIGTPLPLDFRVNVSDFVTDVLIDLTTFPILETSGRVSLNGLPLKLNFNGSNEGGNVDENVQTTLDGQRYTFTDINLVDRVFEYTRTGGFAGQEFGTYEEIVEDGSPIVPLPPGDYSYQSTITDGVNPTLIMSYISGTPPAITIITLRLDFLPGLNGLHSSNTPPFTGSSVPFTYE